VVTLPGIKKMITHNAFDNREAFELADANLPDNYKYRMAA